MRSQILKGFDKMQKRLKDLDFIQGPVGPFLREWKEDYKREAIKFAPEWKRGIKDSIENAQDTKKFPLWARVFSDNPVARWSNYGTGVLSEDPDSSRQPYFPSVQGVTEWAESKGWDPYAVALMINRRGGTEPTRFFQRAAESANSRMDDRLRRFRGGIEHEAGIAR